VPSSKPVRKMRLRIRRLMVLLVVAGLTCAGGVAYRNFVGPIITVAEITANRTQVPVVTRRIITPFGYADLAALIVVPVVADVAWRRWTRGKSG
jgi:hypothetical protein